MPMLPYSLYTLISLWFLLASSLTLSSNANASDTAMIDLTKPNEYQLWRSTNDNVMGGISQGGVRYDGETSLFSGELSLENNGGFSSANRSIEIAPEMVEVALTFIGDGRTYQMRFASWNNGNRVTYKHEFTTEKGKQQTKTFKLEDFKATFRGRPVYNAPTLIAKDVKQLGVLIADKRAGSFELKLIKIEFQP
ncbi:hypothetical protein JCM19232_3359 [Vibrio ishigakensis]|uniref:NADH:ubiquinone oxidoreductase intermediate-associated protein 30 domain-containing protein n=1 Tax=Vibrio ishigakensis TaxID=1481914 RepID=A0A0B8PLT9_9VIBR|nr:hypothetical protein JCM19232_3359 [Vibrio ishigakensis]